MRTREEKETEVTLLREKLQRANSVFVMDYRGLTVPEANDLRGRIRETGKGQLEYRVTKNTLIRLALQGTAAEALLPYLTGPTALALSYDEPAALAKLLVGYSGENDKLEIKGGLVEGEIFELTAIKKLAELPSRDELRAKLAATLRAPMQQLAASLQDSLGRLRRALEARQKQVANPG